MTVKVKYQTNRDNTTATITEQWVVNNRGWIVRPKGKYFVLPQYVQGIISVLSTDKIIRCLPLINKEKLYYVKAL